MSTRGPIRQGRPGPPSGCGGGRQPRNAKARGGGMASTVVGRGLVPSGVVNAESQRGGRRRGESCPGPGVTGGSPEHSGARKARGHHRGDRGGEQAEEDAPLRGATRGLDPQGSHGFCTCSSWTPEGTNRFPGRRSRHGYHCPTGVLHPSGDHGIGGVVGGRSARRERPGRGRKPRRAVGPSGSGSGSDLVPPLLPPVAPRSGPHRSVPRTRGWGAIPIPIPIPIWNR